MQPCECLRRHTQSYIQERGRVALQYNPRRVIGDAASLSTQDKCSPEHTAALVCVVLTSQRPFWLCKVVTCIPACTEDEEREKAEASTTAETAKKEKQKNKKAKQKVGSRSAWPHMLAQHCDLRRMVQLLRNMVSCLESVSNLQ